MFISRNGSQYQPPRHSMKIHLLNERNEALTWPEVLVSVLMTTVIVSLLFAIAISVREILQQRAENIACVNNLKQLGMELRVWENDNGNRRSGVAPVKTQAVPDVNAGQSAWINAMGLSNILSCAKILHCPADKEPAPGNGLKIPISYFLNLDASEMYPQMLLAGDDNLVLGDPKSGQRRPMDSMGIAGNAGLPLKPGVWNIPSNMPLTWAPGRHGDVANVSFADGSVSEVSSHGLKEAIQNGVKGTQSSKNRWAVP